MTVLILARELDPQVDRLIQVLNERRVPVFRTDLAAFPTALTLDARSARMAGLRCPPSLVTNKPASVRNFAATIDGPLAAKTLAAAALVESGRLQIAYTRRVDSAELADLAGVEVTAHLFQRFIQPKAFEARGP